MDTFESILGADILTFLLFTCGIMGWIAFMTGQALAATWRPLWQAFPYGVLLGVADRFFVYALFAGELLSLSGFVIHTLLLIGVSLLAYRMTQVRKMITQYPWLVERTGLLGWRERGGGGA